MRAKQITTRRARNRELGRMDAEQRCVVCKRNLAETGEILEDFLVPGKCCSEACLKDLLTPGPTRGRGEL